MSDAQPVQPGESDCQERELVTVRIIGLPLQVHARAQEHAAGLQREFQLIVEQSREDEEHVPARLLQLSRTLSQRYSGFTDEQEDRIQAGIDAGEAALGELVFVLPAHVDEAARAIAAILDQADEYCRAGDLLTLATPPDLVVYRNWYLDNFITQINGAPPTPWPGDEND